MSRTRVAICVILLTLLGFSLGFSELVVIGIEPELAEAFDVSLSHVGELISVFSVAYAICTPLLAITTGRFRRFHLLIAYFALFCVANAVAAMAPTFGVLIVARILLGTVSGALLALGVTYIPELVGVQHMSLVLSVVYSAFSVAMVIATPTSKIIADAFNWHAAMTVALVFAVIVSVSLLIALPRTDVSDGPTTMRDQLRLLKEPQLLTGILVFVFGVGSVYVFYGYITPYLEDVLGMDVYATSVMLMVYGVVCFISNLIAGWLDLKYGAKALLVSFPIQAVMLLALFLLTPAMPWSLAAMLLIALTMYLLSVPIISLFMRVARQRHPKAMTLASSVEPMAFNIGIAFGTAIGGVVVAGPGIRFVGLVGAVFSLVATALMALTLTIDRRRMDGGRV